MCNLGSVTFHRDSHPIFGWLACSLCMSRGYGILRLAGEFGTARSNFPVRPRTRARRLPSGPWCPLSRPVSQTWCSAGRQRTGCSLTLRVCVQLFLYSSCCIWRYSALYGAGKIECGSSPEKKKKNYCSHMLVVATPSRLHTQPNVLWLHTQPSWLVAGS